MLGDLFVVGQVMQVGQRELGRVLDEAVGRIERLARQDVLMID